MGVGGFSDLVGTRLPLQLAPLGGRIGTPRLAAAVAEAGGLGMIPNPASATEVERSVEAARALTSQPLGFGFLVPFLVGEAVEAAAALAEVVEFFYGNPDPDLIRLAKVRGAIVGWQTGSAAEALVAVECGCDYVVAQGIEAGGHVRGRQRLDELLAETLSHVDVPVVAAGGIGTAERAARLLRDGVAAIRIGTRFVAAVEADAHPTYVELLIAATREDTVLTEVFGTDWSDAPHRVLRTCVDAAAFEGGVVALSGDRDIPPFASTPPTRDSEGEITAMALYAGESVDAVTRALPASEIVAELTRIPPVD